MSITLVEGQQRELNVQLTPEPVEPARLFGVIINQSTGLPVSGAVLLFQGGVQMYGEVTDSNGYYDIPNIEPGVYDGLVQAEGYLNYPF